MGKRISGIILIGIISMFFIGGCGKKEEPKENLTKTEYNEEKVTEILKETEDLLNKTKEDKDKKEDPKKDEKEEKKEDTKEEVKEDKEDPLAMEDKIPFEKKKYFLDEYDKLYNKYMNNDREKIEKVKEEDKAWKKLLNEVLDYLYKDKDSHKVVAIKQDQDEWEKEIEKIEKKNSEKAKELNKYKELILNYQERIKILISNYVE